MMHNSHNQMKIKLVLRTFMLKMAVNSKEKVWVNGGQGAGNNFLTGGADKQKKRSSPPSGDAAGVLPPSQGTEGEDPRHLIGWQY